jgi:hypothetical protein
MLFQPQRRAAFGSRDLPADILPSARFRRESETDGRCPPSNPADRLRRNRGVQAFSRIGLARRGRPSARDQASLSAGAPMPMSG